MNEPGDPAEKFAGLYDIPLDEIRLFNEQQFADEAQAGTLDPEVFGKINLSCGRLIGLGRSAEYPSEHYISTLNSFSYRPCMEVVNRPVIYPNGDLQACCCAGGKIEAFRVGSLLSHSLRDLVEIMRERSHYRFINNFGPRLLYETICAVCPGSTRRDEHASICDICVAATRDIEGAEVDRILEHWALGQLIGGELLQQPHHHGLTSDADPMLIWPTVAT
ncbi:MAG TPA: hypothetical protein VK638_43215 [Edaphobacter sp.]|nr:hypothetical protein [Edaphobacter sp.]